MKIAVAKEHGEYFRMNGMLEIAELIEAEQLRSLLRGIETACAQRAKSYEPLAPHEMFLQGRDLWRSHPEIKKIVVNRRLAEVFTQLTDQRFLRLGYDQLLPSVSEQEPPSIYKNFLSEAKDLSECSALQGIAGGLMLCLKGDPEQPSHTVFSTVPGNGVFFTSQHPIDFTAMPKNALYLMIVYTDISSVYIVNRKDPLVHGLMSYGYNYGDRLNDRANPVLCR